MTLDHDNILCEQEELKLFNQHLETQVASLQNNSARTEGNLESERPPNLLALDELIQKWIVEAMCPDDRMCPYSKVAKKTPDNGMCLHSETVPTSIHPYSPDDGISPTRRQNVIFR